MSTYSLNLNGVSTDVPATRPAKWNGVKPILDDLTPHARTAVAGLITLWLLDLAVCNVCVKPATQEAASLAPRPIALAVVSPIFHVEAMTLRDLPATPLAPLPTRITDLEMPGEASMGSNPIADTHSADDAAQVVMTVPPDSDDERPLHNDHSKRVSAKLHPVAAVQAPAPKPDADAFVDSTPAFFSTRSMMESKDSRPRPF